MNKLLDEALSFEIADRIKSKVESSFDNAYRAALATKEANYVQGFLAFVGRPCLPMEHSWIEIGDRIIDPTLPYLDKKAEELWYFPAQSLNLKQLKAIIEESQEDYPEDDPLPIYGEPPYEYYGDVMLGGKSYLEAYQAAEAKCIELNQQNAETN